MAAGKLVELRSNVLMTSATPELFNYEKESKNQRKAEFPNRGFLGLGGIGKTGDCSHAQAYFEE